MTLCNSIAGEALLVTCEPPINKMRGEVSSLFRTFSFSTCRQFAITESEAFDFGLNRVCMAPFSKCVENSPFNLFSGENSWRFSLTLYSKSSDTDSESGSDKRGDMASESRGKYFNINLASYNEFLLQSHLYTINSFASTIAFIKNKSQKKDTKLFTSNRFDKKNKICFVGKLMLENGLTLAQRAESRLYRAMVSPGELPHRFGNDSKTITIKGELNSLLSGYSVSEINQNYQKNDEYILPWTPRTQRATLFSSNAIRRILTTCEEFLSQKSEIYQHHDNSMLADEAELKNNRQLLQLASKIKEMRRCALRLNSNCSISQARLSDSVLYQRKLVEKGVKSIRGIGRKQINEHTNASANANTYTADNKNSNANHTNYMNEKVPERWRKKFIYSGLLTMSKNFSLGNKDGVLWALRQKKLFAQDRHQQASVTDATKVSDGVKDMTQAISNSRFVKKADMAMRDLLRYQQSTISGDHRYHGSSTQNKNLIEQHAAAPLVKELKQRFNELQKNNTNESKALLQAVQSLTESMNQAVAKQAMEQHSVVRPLNFLGPL